MKIFIHGVPDTPFMWSPLLAALGDVGRVEAPALPGFGEALPKGFTPTKEAYLAWLIAELERAAAADGPVDLVGHDWGALLSVRAAALRPDLIRTWTVTNALPDPQYRWHQAARAWQTPFLGELAMALVPFQDLKEALVRGGMPADIAAHEAPRVDRTMRQAILRLYRSAVDVGSEWGEDLQSLPKRGLVFWGTADAFVGVDVAERFCARWSVALHKEEGAGHWAMIERPEAAAAHLRAHWA